MGKGPNSKGASKSEREGPLALFLRRSPGSWSWKDQWPGWEENLKEEGRRYWTMILPRPVILSVFRSPARVGGRMIETPKFSFLRFKSAA